MGVEVFRNHRTLNELADYFGGSLYVVGGAVRDALCGKTPSDIDLAAPLKGEKVEILLKKSDFHVCAESPRLGTLKIFRGNESFEYTAFRVDSYAEGGRHAPSEVRFTENIEEDAMRRDFTVNALYYDIKSGAIVDPLGGVADMHNMKLKTCREPEKTLGEDGLRLMRLVRIAAETGFIIDKETYAAAVSCAALLADVSEERKRDELLKILNADLKNGVTDGHYRGLQLLLSLGLLEFIAPELLENKDFPQNAEYHKYAVLEHVFQTVRFAEPRVRVAALFHDVAKALCKRKFGKMQDHPAEGAKMTDEIMRRLKFSNAERERVVRLVETHMYDLDCKTGENKLRRFIQKNFDLIDDLCALKNADGAARGFGEEENPSAARMAALRDEMVSEGVPMTIAELSVNGADLIELGIPEKRRREALRTLLAAAATDKALRTREGQVKFLKSFKV